MIIDYLWDMNCFQANGKFIIEGMFNNAPFRLELTTEQVAEISPEMFKFLFSKVARALHG